MIRLTLILHAMVSTTLMGAGIVAALVAGFDTARPIAIVAGLGFLLAIPASWLIARRIVAAGRVRRDDPARPGRGA
ncbi:MAG: CTP synthetase [Pseudomonadota bacterium]|nr:CTP synthetase [Pseudomonadota bacterium]MEE3099437.1 CTP synthetase [Pseudomonadota bacterium]